MPIGKNSIKRVTNNGYSKVTTSAPDMENSVAIEEKTEIKKAPSSKQTEAKKTVRKTPTKAPVTKKAPTVSNKKPPVKTPAKPKEAVVTTEEKKESTSYVNLGRDLPAYLL